MGPHCCVYKQLGAGESLCGAFFGAQLGSTFKESELAKEVKIFLVATARPGSGSVNSLQNVS